MTALLQIIPLEHSLHAVAERIHAVQMAAYRQEAELIEAVHFPPLESTVEQLRSSGAQYFGAFVGDAMAGVVAIEFENEGLICVSSLVVTPEWQRQGIGKELMAYVLRSNRSQSIEVQTATRNTPAVTLYRSLGFRAIRAWVVGSPGLELVRLTRPAGHTHDAG